MESTVETRIYRGKEISRMVENSLRKMEFVDDSQETIEPPSAKVQERLTWLISREVAITALKGFLRSIDREIPDDDGEIREYIADTLTDTEFKALQDQFRFGGRKSLNFFVITGISEKIGELPSKVKERFPAADEVHGEKGRPYITESRTIGDRLYLIFGHNVATKTVDPETGEPRRRLDPHECVAVIQPSTDLVHVRTADVPLAKDICEKIAESVKISTNEPTFYKPLFDENFMENFSDYVEKYLNLSVRVQEESDGTVGSIKFKSKKDDTGVYMNLLEDERVRRELEDKEGEISQGYVELAEGNFSFRINRSQSKIWFRSYEREERLTAIVELIDDVLRQSGGYPQRKLQGFENVPE